MAPRERCHVIQFLPLHSSLAKVFMIRQNAFCILFGGATNLRSIHLCANMDGGWWIRHFQLPILLCLEGEEYCGAFPFINQAPLTRA